MPKRRKLNNDNTSRSEIEIIDSYSEQSRASTSGVNFNQASTPYDDEIKTFINFIENKMKKYNDQTKICVQKAICDVIFKTDQMFYAAEGDPLIKHEKSERCCHCGRIN